MAHQAVQAGALDAASGVNFLRYLKFKAGFRPATLERIKLRRNSSVVLQQTILQIQTQEMNIARFKVFLQPSGAEIH